jgi:transposase
MRVWRMPAGRGDAGRFRAGAPIEQGDGKTRRSWVLRAVLSYSRKAYSEAVLRQDTESLLRFLENALRHFGGVPLLLNIDNLKAAVLKADWFDPQINPRLADFCSHYRIHVMPCCPRMRQHKGKVERGVSYVRGNALKGRRFNSLAQENSFLIRRIRVLPGVEGVGARWRSAKVTDSPAPPMNSMESASISYWRQLQAQ